MTTTKKTRLYQDIDGCLNASWNARAWQERGSDNDAGYKYDYACVYHSDLGLKGDSIRGTFKMEWNKYLIDELNLLDVELVWLTTWRADALSVGTMMGLYPQTERVLHPLSGVTGYPSIFWKYDALVAEQEENPSPFIWVDDELRDTVGWKRDAINSLGGLIIAPDPNFGVTPKHIEMMKEYINQ